MPSACLWPRALSGRRAVWGLPGAVDGQVSQPSRPDPQPWGRDKDPCPVASLESTVCAALCSSNCAGPHDVPRAGHIPGRVPKHAQILEPLQMARESRRCDQGHRLQGPGMSLGDRVGPVHSS